MTAALELFGLVDSQSVEPAAAVSLKLGQAW